jgi:hypothetical protein
MRNKVLKNALPFIAEGKLLFTVCVTLLQLNGQHIYHMLIYSCLVLMVTVYAFMNCLANYAAEWGDIVPQIKVRGVIPCVVNIFPREGRRRGVVGGIDCL